MYTDRIGENKTERDRVEGLVKNELIDAINVTDLTITNATADDVTINNDLSMSGTTGEGIKLPADFGWHDITAAIEVKGVGANDPTWSQVSTGPFYAYKFAVGDECWMSFHIPHDYVPGTDIHFHTHWIPDGTNTAAVKWQYGYMYADGHNQANFVPAGTTITAEESPPGSAFRHMITETSAITISGMEVDGVIYSCIKRITNGATDNTDGIFVLTSDIHYQSTGLPTQNKAPDFYA